MKTAAFRSFDVLLNVCAPLLAGILLYFYPAPITFPRVIKNHLADGLWAYSFISMLLVVWDREIKPIWVCIPFLAGGLFEWLQYKHVIAGTGDFYDLLTYYAFMLFSLILNSSFKYQNTN